MPSRLSTTEDEDEDDEAAADEDPGTSFSLSANNRLVQASSASCCM